MSESPNNPEQRDFMKVIDSEGNNWWSKTKQSLEKSHESDIKLEPLTPEENQIEDEIKFQEDEVVKLKREYYFLVFVIEDKVEKLIKAMQSLPKNNTDIFFREKFYIEGLQKIVLDTKKFVAENYND